MPYIPNTKQDRRAMLDTIGVGSIDDLFKVIPDEIKLQGLLNVPEAMGEMELAAHLQTLAAKNKSAATNISFLGGGSYDHFIPSVVDAISGRSEFLTSYTPYQPEVSQGNLQALFEYQTMITQLTGLDVSNASLYEGGTAVAEAAIMAMATTRRWDKIVVAESMHPEYRQVLKTYLVNLGVEIVTVPAPKGAIDPVELEKLVDDKTACVIVQHPNFFGALEDVDALVKITHEKKALYVASFDPISVGLIKRPGEYNADIAVAEGQCLGSPLNFGGPYLGIMSCSEKFVRRMPGRIAGQTKDRDGKRCWVLTMQTREQHIRREKATSNICTNEGIIALRAAVYMSTMGPDGFKSVANLCLQKSRYALEQLTACDHIEAAFDQPTFKEFVIRFKDGGVSERITKAKEQGIFAGISMECWYPHLKDCLLICVTEKRTKEEIDQLVKVLG